MAIETGNIGNIDTKFVIAPTDERKADMPAVVQSDARDAGLLAKEMGEHKSNLFQNRFLDNLLKEAKGLKYKKGDELNKCTKKLCMEIEQLGEIGIADEKIISVLMDIYNKETTTEIEKSIGKTLKKLDGKAVPYLVKYLNFKNPKCYLATYLLGDIGAKSAPAVPQILKLTLAGNRDLDVRIRLTLKDIGGSASPYLKKHLKNNEWQIRAMAAEGLGNIGKYDAETLGILRKLLVTDNNPNVRANAAYALGSRKEKAVSAVPELIMALEHKDQEVKENSLVALANIAIKREDVISAIIKLLGKEKNLKVRSLAINILGESKSLCALPFIEQALKSDKHEIIIAGIVASGKMGKLAKPLIPYLEKLVDKYKNKSGWIYEGAKDAIELIKK